MRGLLIAMALSVACGPSFADDIRCLQATGGAKSPRLTLTLFSHEEGQLSGGMVHYAGQSNSLPIVFKSSEVVNEVEGRSWEFRSTWLEVLPSEERIGGRYSFHHQGAVLFNFQYHNLRTGKTFHFEEAYEALDNSGHCNWPD